MTNREFTIKAKALAKKWVENAFEVKLTNEDDVYVVWSTYVLGYMKCLVSTTVKGAPYFEVTFNKEKNEIYFDVYSKVLNKCIEIKG